MNSEAQPELKIVGYCRACGKALEESSVRGAQGTIYCEEHVPQETTYSASAAHSTGAGYTAPADSPYSGSTPPPVPQSDSSPGLAAVLGWIPGVGAIYNGQYAKGFVHLFILGMLFSIANSNIRGLQPLFVLMIIGFWFYMPFEAYHTARRRRLGLPVDEFSSIVPSPGAQLPLMPLLLILFGGIILLDNLDLLRIDRILPYWPALMIAMGVYLLNARAKRRGGSGDGSSAGAGDDGGTRP
jgi:hypothetical protein